MHRIPAHYRVLVEHLGGLSSTIGAPIRRFFAGHLGLYFDDFPHSEYILVCWSLVFTLDLLKITGYF